MICSFHFQIIAPIASTGRSIGLEMQEKALPVICFATVILFFVKLSLHFSMAPLCITLW